MKLYLCPKCDHRTPSLSGYELHLRSHDARWDAVNWTLRDVDGAIAAVAGGVQ